MATIVEQSLKNILKSAMKQLKLSGMLIRWSSTKLVMESTKGHSLFQHWGKLMGKWILEIYIWSVTYKNEVTVTLTFVHKLK